MRKMLFVLMAFVLTACATPLTKDQVDALVAQIQAYTQTACQFQPTAATVAQLVSAFIPEAAVVGGIVVTVGNAICAAPITQTASRQGLALQSRTVRLPNGKTVIVKGTSLGKR